MFGKFRENWRPILVLIIITPFLTELLSGNMTLVAILNPVNFLALVIIAYSLPVLAIRELAVRWNLGFFGIFLVGLAYGIFNEGILAKTILLQHNVPLSDFDNYIYHFGINFSWMPVILVWHALHSVLFPILLTYFFFPGHTSQPWLSKKTTFIVLIPAVVLVTAAFFGNTSGGVVGTLPHFVFFVALMFGLFCLARVFKMEPEKIVNRSAFWPVVVGFLIVIFFLIIPSVLADNKTSPPIFYAYLLISFLLFIFFLRNARNDLHKLLFVGLGMYIASAIFGLIGQANKGNFPEIFVEIAFVMIFIVLIRKNERLIEQPQN